MTKMRVLAGWLLCLAAACAGAGSKPIRLPDADLKQPIIWGGECVLPDGTGLAFGGQDRDADDGIGRTRIKTADGWKPVTAELRSANPLQKSHGPVWAARCRLKDLASRTRHIWFEGLPPTDETKLLAADVLPALGQLAKDLDALAGELAALKDLPDYEAGQAQRAAGRVRQAAEKIRFLAATLAKGVSADAIKALSRVQIELELAAEALDAEPPGRALSPIVHDDKGKLFILFGGDHLDYLASDTWVFDPAKKKWTQRHPASAPPPRAMHELKAADGKVALTGGYAYTSNTDYCGGQYALVGDGEWTYDVAGNAWTGPAAGVPSDSRVYRTGPYHPDFYLRGDKPAAAGFQDKLKAIAANTWVMLEVVHRPRLDRVWGTSIYDPDRDLILVWSGGHSSHGGSDVLHYHPATGRWELAFPVEFPLGQLYSNTSYPDSFNLNRRPWVTGHTYRSYGYDPVLRKMLFVGHHANYYIYDPAVADWTGRAAKPRQMAYSGCFYDLTVCSTPQGATAWGGYYGRREYSKISRFDARTSQWVELELKGDQLPGSVCDSCCMVYDSKRDRLLCIVPTGKERTVQVVEVDIKTGQVKNLSPAGTASAGKIGFLREFCYHPEHDLVIGTTLLPAGADGLLLTPAYDCAKNRWVSLKIAGPNPSGKSGRDVSLGLMYDSRRKLVWGVNNYHLQPHVMRLDPATADLQPLP